MILEDRIHPEARQCPPCTDRLCAALNNRREGRSLEFISDAAHRDATRRFVVANDEGEAWNLNGGTLQTVSSFVLLHRAYILYRGEPRDLITLCTSLVTEDTKKLCW